MATATPSRTGKALNRSKGLLQDNSSTPTSPSAAAAATTGRPKQRVLEEQDVKTIVLTLPDEEDKDPPSLPPAPGGTLLESVITSPELLAKALLKLCGGAEQASELLGSALNYISSTTGHVLTPTPGKTVGFSSGNTLVQKTAIFSSQGHSQADDGATATEISAFAEEEDLSHEQLQIIKAVSSALPGMSRIALLVFMRTLLLLQSCAAYDVQHGGGNRRWQVQAALSHKSSG